MNLSTHARPARPAGRPQRHLGRPRVNITPAERAGRIILGVAAVTTAAILLASAGTTLAVALEILLGLAGLDLSVTGAVGHCPLYQRLGYVPARLRRTS